MLLLDNIKTKWDSIHERTQFFAVAASSIVGLLFMLLFVLELFKVGDLNHRVADLEKTQAQWLADCQQTTSLHTKGIYFKCQQIYTDAQAVTRLETSVKKLQIIPGDDVVGQAPTPGTLASVRPD